MLQRWVPGDEYGVTVLCRAGEILAMSAHHRLRSLSSLGGASTAKETIAVTEAFKGHVECLVRRLSWTGPAMLEFRGDPNGKFVLLEMNGRFWGSLPLAVIAGLNFPLLAFQMAIDSALTEKRQARVGVCSRHMMGDAARILHMKGASCFSAIGDFLRGFFPPFHDDVWEIADPFPWLWDIWDSFIR
jgi:predicted ATP-grasp superfamily ATP-dependent carboligase